MKKVFQIIIIFILISFLKIQPVSAAQLQKTHDRSYTFQNGFVHVVERKIFTILDSNAYIPSDSSEDFLAYIKNPNLESTISVKDSDGNDLNFKKQRLEDILKITVTFGKKVYSTFTMILEYDADLISNTTGNVTDFYVPSFSKDYSFTTNIQQESITTKLIIPKSFGKLNFVSSNFTDQSDDTNYVFNFKQEDLLGKTPWVQIGQLQLFKFILNQEIKPTSNFSLTSNVYKLILPRNIDTGKTVQKVFFTSFSVQPYKVYLDENNNLIGEFRIPSSEEGLISVTGYAEVHTADSFKITTGGLIKDIPSEIIANNTKSAQYWESDSNSIKNAAAQIKGGETDVYKILLNTYDFVTSRINYDEVKKFGTNERKGALATLESGSGVCMEYSDLFIALMRANGIPARASFGFAYSSNDKNGIGENNLNHQWAQVYIPSLKKWIDVDTTWGDAGYRFIGGDLNHFYSHVTSISPDNPSTSEVLFYGSKEGNIPSRKISIEIVKEVENSTKLNQDELLLEYSNVNYTLRDLEIIFRGFDKQVSKAIQSAIPSISNQALIIVRIIIYFAILLILFKLLFGLIKKVYLNYKNGKVIHNIKNLKKSSTL